MPDLMTLTNNLSVQSLEKMQHPLKEIDFDYPIKPDQYFMHPDLSFLSGTKEFDLLEESEKMKITFAETINLFAAGLWLEQILIHGFMRSLYTLSANSEHFLYRLIEVEEEVHHNMMFSEFLKRSGFGDHKVKKLGLFLGWVYKYTSKLSEALFLTSILAAEEITDFIAKESLKLNSLHPVAKQIFKIHRKEEARHKTYARSYIKDKYKKMGFISRNHLGFFIPLITKLIVSQLFRPDFYKTLGIKNADALIQAAIKNKIPEKQNKILCQSFVSIMKDLKIIDNKNIKLWNWLNLV